MNVRLALSALLASALAACSSPAPPAPEFATLSVAGLATGPPLAEPTTPPEELSGVDTDDLSDREKGIWWKLVSQTYAPCTDQAVSIAACVKEARPCAACAPAAALVATKVHEGLAPIDVQGAYAARFGSNVKRAEALDSPSRGAANAPVTIVVWSDFQCPACKHAMPLLDHAVERFEGKVRLVHKFYPLKMHTFAEGAARAAVAAKNQGKYWEMEHLLFDNQRALEASDLDGYAMTLRLDMARFHQDLTSAATDAWLARDRAAADEAGLGATPFILINGRELDSSFFRLDKDLEPWIELEIDLAGKR